MGHLSIMQVVFLGPAFHDQACILSFAYTPCLLMVHNESMNGLRLQQILHAHCAAYSICVALAEFVQHWPMAVCWPCNTANVENQNDCCATCRVQTTLRNSSSYKPKLGALVAGQAFDMGRRTILSKKSTDWWDSILKYHRCLTLLPATSACVIAVHTLP